MPDVAPRKEVSNDLKQLRQRRIYLSARLPRVKAEIKALSDENKLLAKQLEAKKDAPDRRPTVERKIYVAQHLLALKTELRSLEVERPQVLEKLKKMNPKVQP